MRAQLIEIRACVLPSFCADCVPLVLMQEYCFFMKETKDAVKLRNRIQEVFELAALPGTEEEDIRKLLAFVVVGGGPTGVEFAGTLSDFLRQDLKRKFPSLMPYVSVTLLQSAQSILTQFDSRLAARALETFEKTEVNVRTGVRVVEVSFSLAHRAVMASLAVHKIYPYLPSHFIVGLRLLEPL